MSEGINKTLWVIVVLGFALLWGTAELLDSDTMPIKMVKIKGVFTHVRRHDVQQILLPWVQTGFFALPASKIRGLLISKPWIKDADITRVWPDTITVAIQEQQPIARFGRKGLINSGGEVFYPEGTLPSNLPLLNGPEHDAVNLLQQYRQFQTILSSLGLNIAELNLSARHALSLKLDNGMQLFLGRERAITRLNRFVKVYNNVFGSRGADAASVDLRYPNGMAVHWKQTT